eukprot:jgi/Tetstr1/440911/TSEL_029182.t1
MGTGDTSRLLEQAQQRRRAPARSACQAGEGGGSASAGSPRCDQDAPVNDAGARPVKPGAGSWSALGSRRPLSPGCSGSGPKIPRTSSRRPPAPDGRDPDEGPGSGSTGRPPPAAAAQHRPVRPGGGSGAPAELRNGEAEISGRAPRVCARVRRARQESGPRQQSAPAAPPPAPAEAPVPPAGSGRAQDSWRCDGVACLEGLGETPLRPGDGPAGAHPSLDKRARLRPDERVAGERCGEQATAAAGHSRRPEIGVPEGCKSASDEYGRGAGGAGRPAECSCSGSLAANSGSASISGAGSGSLSLEAEAGAKATTPALGRPSRRHGAGDNMSASRPASCGESFVEVADGGNTSSRRSKPAASATGPCGAEDRSPGHEVLQQQQQKALRWRGVRKRPRPLDPGSGPLARRRSEAGSGARSRLGPGEGPSAGEGESCPGYCEDGAHSGLRCGIATPEEREALLRRLRRLSARTLRSLVLTLLFRHPAILAAGAAKLAGLALPLPPAGPPPGDTFDSAFGLAAGPPPPPLPLPEAHLQLYTVSNLRRPCPPPVSLILKQDRVYAAQMTEPGPDCSHAILTRLDLPDQAGPPTSVACSCNGRAGDSSLLLWCPHVAGLAAAAASPAAPRLDLLRAEAALDGRPPEVLADLLYALAIAADCARWLGQHLEMQGSSGDGATNAAGGAPQDTSSAVEDTPAAGQPGPQHSRSQVVTSKEDLHTIEQFVTCVEKLNALPAAQSKLIIEQCERGKPNTLPPTEEILQKVWDLVAAEDTGHAWELLREVTAAATHSAVWRRLREGMPAGSGLPPVDGTVPQALGFPGQEAEPLLNALIVVWESVTAPAQRAMFFAPLWDGGVPTPRAAANAAAAPGWKRGAFSAYPHVCAVSLVGAVVGLVPGVLAGMAAAEALQARCSHELMASHLGMLLSLGAGPAADGDSPAPAALLRPAAAPPGDEFHGLMEDLHGLAHMLSAHAVWEQRLGVWDLRAWPAANGSGSCSSSKLSGEEREAGRAPPRPLHRPPSWTAGSSNTTTTRLPSAGASHGPLPQTPLPSSALPWPPQAPPTAGWDAAPPRPPPRLGPPSSQPQAPPQPQPAGGRVPSLLWISATAAAAGMALHRPADRLKVLAMLVPPPSQHNAGWRGQAALITCLAASTGATANMFLMGMMASHHLRNLFDGAGVATLSQLKLGCATLLALAPDEASAISGCYFLEVCIAIVCSPTAVPNQLPPPPPQPHRGGPSAGPAAGAAAAADGGGGDPLLSRDAVVQHVLDTLLTVMEREGVPAGRPTIMMAALQSLCRILRRGALLNLARVVALQQLRWVRVLVRAAHLQASGPGGRVATLVVVKALEVLWALMGRCSGSVQHPARASMLAEVGPAIVAAASKVLAGSLAVLEAPSAFAPGPADWIWEAACRRQGGAPVAAGRGDGNSVPPRAADRLLQSADAGEFAREAAARVAAALGYSPAVDGPSSGRPAFERALLAPLLGGLLGEPGAGVAARLAAARLLAAMLEREYGGVAATLASAPGTVTTLLNLLDRDPGRRAGREPDDAATVEALVAAALRALVALYGGPPPAALGSASEYGHHAGAGAGAASWAPAPPPPPGGTGHPQLVGASCNVAPGGGGGFPPTPALPSQQLWKKVARHRVVRRLAGVAQRYLVRAGEGRHDDDRGSAGPPPLATGGRFANADAGAATRPDGTPPPPAAPAEGMSVGGAVEALHWLLLLLEALARYKPGLLLEVDTALLDDAQRCCAGSPRRHAADAAATAERLRQVHALAARPT